MGVEIYPNPAQDAFNISFPLADARDITATIFNLMGKEMSATELNAVEGANVFTINVSELASGIYTIVLTNADGTNSSHKFVKH